MQNGPIHMANGHAGTGTGFMGFGPTGFTTPIDTVLDRFGRTGTIFPSVSNYGNGTGPPYGVHGPMGNGPINLQGPGNNGCFKNKRHFCLVGSSSAVPGHIITQVFTGGAIFGPT